METFLRIQQSDDWQDVCRNGIAVDVVEPVDWNNNHKVHDWKNYVPEIVQELWNELTMESRMIAYMMAEQQASNEEWD